MAGVMAVARSCSTAFALEIKSECQRDPSVRGDVDGLLRLQHRARDAASESARWPTAFAAAVSVRRACTTVSADATRLLRLTTALAFAVSVKPVLMTAFVAVTVRRNPAGDNCVPVPADTNSAIARTIGAGLRETILRGSDDRVRPTKICGASGVDDDGVGLPRRFPQPAGPASASDRHDLIKLNHQRRGVAR